MSDKEGRGHEDLLAEKSKKSIKCEKSGQPAFAEPVQGFSFEEISVMRRLRNFLNRTEPAMLLVWCAAAFVVAALLGYLSFRIAGFQSDFLEYQWSPDSMYSMDTTAKDRSAVDILRDWAGIAAGLGAFLLGIVGTLLPMWAVGRLIADAIREGNKS